MIETLWGQCVTSRDLRLLVVPTLDLPVRGCGGRV